LTKSEPEDATQRSDAKQEMLPENSCDVQLPEGDLEGLLKKEQHSYERQSRKTNEVPDHVRPPVLTQDTEQQPRKKDGVQPLDDNQQRPPTMEVQDGVQHSEVNHHEEPEATIQSPDGKTSQVLGDVQSSNTVPENPPDVMHEQQPRKKIDKPLDDIQTSGVVQEIEVAESTQPSDLDREGSLIDEHHQNGCPPGVMREREPRKKVLDHVQPQATEVQDREPRKRNSE